MLFCIFLSDSSINLKNNQQINRLLNESLVAALFLTSMVRCVLSPPWRLPVSGSVLLSLHSIETTSFSGTNHFIQNIQVKENVQSKTILPPPSPFPLLTSPHGAYLERSIRDVTDVDDPVVRATARPTWTQQRSEAEQEHREMIHTHTHTPTHTHTNTNTHTTHTPHTHTHPQHLFSHHKH